MLFSLGIALLFLWLSLHVVLVENFGDSKDLLETVLVATGGYTLCATAEQKSDRTDYCSHVILQLHHFYDPNKINLKVKIVSGTPCGAVAVDAKKKIASWIVLDKHLKHEEKRCMEELQCNIVVMKHSQPKILRLNLLGSPENEPERTAPSGSPPLCSVCQHKAPVFGKPPRWFTYAELELATGGFSQANFLVEGGFGSVHRGVLPDGLIVAVKQHKLTSFQGDQEFCSEVEVLSCAQQRNVVMLIGFCIEDGRRLLVYEYICNGSLDSHLYGSNCLLAFPLLHCYHVRQMSCDESCHGHQKLKFAHVTEDDFCLIFFRKVEDFGLARWQPDGETGVETRGDWYLAPEYAVRSQKRPVFTHLVWFVTGRKAVDLSRRPKGLQ